MNWMQWMLENPDILLFQSILPGISIFINYLIITSLIAGAVFLSAMLYAIILREFGFIGIGYNMMKYSAIVYLIPGGYFLAKFLDKNYQIFGGFLSFFSEAIVYASAGLFIVWLSGVAIQVALYLKERRKVHEALKDRLPFTRMQEAHFQEICRKIGLRATSIDHSLMFSAKSPFNTGIINRRIVLPADDLSLDEWKVSLLHEAVHCKARDILFRNIAMWARILHWFNPLAWLMEKQVYIWGEYACDEKCEACLGKDNHYMRVVYDMIIRFQDAPVRGTARLSSPKSEFGKRTKCLLKARRKNLANMEKAIAFSLAVAGLCTTVTLSGMIRFGAFWRNIYEDTVEDVSVDDDYPSYKYQTDSGFDENTANIINEMEEISLFEENVNYSYEWTISASTAAKSDLFEAEEGDTITVCAVINATDVPVRVGLVLPDSTRIYVEGEEAMSPSFEAPMTGNYSVFVENMGGDIIGVAGAYTVY